MCAIRSKGIALLRGCARIGLSPLLLAAVACATAREEPPIADPDPMLVEVGAELFVTYCASCHGVDALGDGPVAPALRAPLPDLTRIAERSGGVFPESSIAMKIDGRMTPVSQQALTQQHTAVLARSIMNDRQAAEFEVPTEIVVEPVSRSLEPRVMIQELIPGR